MRRQWLWLMVVMVPGMVVGGFEYDSKFVAGKVGDEWSRKEVGTTPAGGRKFLGPFAGHEVVKLELGEFEGDEVRLFRVRFTLFIIHGSDGNYAYYGPDPWVLRLAGGRELWRTTFSNCGFISVNNDQGYPDPFPGTHYPGWSGAAEKQTLGFVKTWSGVPHGVDSVYEMEAVFAHRGGELALEFVSESEETISGEAWGLERVRVEETAPVKRGDAEWEKLWGDLGGEDAVAATGAIWEFVAGGEGGMDYLKRKFGLGSPADTAEVMGLLEKLDSSDFPTREKASRRLLEMGKEVREALEIELGRKGGSAEKRARMAGLLERIKKREESPPEGDRLREMRVRWAMQAFGE